MTTYLYVIADNPVIAPDGSDWVMAEMMKQVVDAASEVDAVSALRGKILDIIDGYDEEGDEDPGNEEFRVYLHSVAHERPSAWDVVVTPDKQFIETPVPKHAGNQ